MLNEIRNFSILVDSLLMTNSRLDKEEILKAYDCEYNRKILNFIFNPYIVTGISKKKAKKYRNMGVVTYKVNCCGTEQDYVKTYMSKEEINKDLEKGYFLA